MSLDLSLGEFSALVAKAFRGVGYPWGVTNDGAYAARVLAQYRLPAADVVARLLAEIDRYGLVALTVGDPSESGTPHCPVSLGIALADLGDQALQHAPSLIGSRPVLEPILLAPFLSNCVLVWVDGQMTFDRDGMHLTGDVPNGVTSIELISLNTSMGTTESRRHQTSTRAVVAPTTYETLLDFASRTYAPATDASRDGGAG